MRRIRWLALACLLALSACAPKSNGEHPRVVLTERQRDSVIAASGLVGAGVVGRALAASDSAAARAARMNDVTR